MKEIKSNQWNYANVSKLAPIETLLKITPSFNQKFQGLFLYRGVLQINIRILHFCTGSLTNIPNLIRWGNRISQTEIFVQKKRLKLR